MAFSGSPVLFYDVPTGGIWGKLGFGVPNWGKRQVSRNMVIIDLVQVIGRNLQAIMLTDDALSTRPPSINRIIEINKLLMRARQLLTTEKVLDNQLRMEGDKADNDKESFLLFPTPIFFVRNRWLKAYAYYVMHALAEAIQSSENSTSPFEITKSFSEQIGQYFDRILKRMACELLNINPATANSGVPKDTYGNYDWSAFVLTDAQIMAYNPSAWFSSTELIDVAYPTGDIPSDYDLEMLTNGIPIVDMPVLTAFPVTVADSTADTSPDPAALAQANTASNPTATGTAGATLAETNAIGAITGAPIVSPTAPAPTPASVAAATTAAKAA